ncbi:MAG TPA: cytochrome c oxidase subunit 3 family protein [Vicinamibacterales bacterium]|nr:cytochrome c oxidase subunit 3 family protein [Vicinamibacterales bacterium]
MSDAPSAYQPPPVAIHPAGHGHTPHHPYLQHHFDSMAQQAEASTLGMWTFLVTEIMFFGGLFMAYLVYRYYSPMGFQEASHHLDVFWGTLNTALLIISSLTMALAVRSAQTSQPAMTQVKWLVATMLLGLGFLGIKVIEYTDKFTHHLVPGPNFRWEGLYPKPAEQFYSLYFAMTGLHALHMIIGIGIMLVITWMAWRRTFDSEYYTPVEVAGLYWHFVDIVWIFLFPLLYLIGRHFHPGA